MVNHIVDSALSALADPTRRRVVELLSDGPLRAGELAARTSVSRPAMSRQLRLLRENGLVRAELTDADGRGRTYRLDPDGVLAVRAWLDQLEAHWTEQLGAFGAHVRRQVGAAGSIRQPPQAEQPAAQQPPAEGSTRRGSRG